MEYKRWREELFAHPSDCNPVSLELPCEFYAVPSEQAFDFVDRVLVDPEVHLIYGKDQLGNGLQMLYSNSCSNLPFLYTTDCDEPRRLIGIRNLVHLYRNFFERYCTAPVVSIGNDQVDGPMGYLCYMFWDIFVVYPGNSTRSMIQAGLSVMQSALKSRNDNCLASAIHGLGHWVLEAPDAGTILNEWLRHPTTKNAEILQYARTATTGNIL